MKTITLCTIAVVLSAGLCFTASGFAGVADKGPDTMTLATTIDKAKKPKPAVFPHAKHQEELTCGTCHHSKDADGNKIDYVDGQKIEKCELCHNKAAGMPKKINSFKNAAHVKCKGCHKSKDKKLAKCSVCHPKKK